MSELFRPEAIEEIKEKRERWQKEVYREGSEREAVFETLSGFPVEPLYTPEQIADLDYHRDLGLPGEEPFVRGVYPTMYRGRTWTIRQLAGFAPRLSFFLSAHNDFFEEIAKYRAARKLWFRMMKERFGAKNPRSLTFRFHVQTAGVALTAQQPLNNISRAAYHGLSAVLGGPSPCTSTAMTRPYAHPPNFLP